MPDHDGDDHDVHDSQDDGDDHDVHDSQDDGDDADAESRADRSRPALAERRDLETVYQPAEDSRLLADAAVDDVGPEDCVLEVGTGSGYVADRISRETGAAVVGVDLNRGACEATRDRGIPVVRGDLVSAFRSDTFDVVCSNPPYLPTPSEMEWDDAMEAALSGGESGRAVVEPLLDDVGRVLAPGGHVLLLVSTLTDLDAVRGYAAERGLDPAVVAEESHPFERLVVLRLDPSP